jgi:hypothetical protein
MSGLERFMADDLRVLFNPRAAVFVGVSPDPMKYAGRALTSLRQRGFAGPIFAVNPKYVMCRVPDDRLIKIPYLHSDAALRIRQGAEIADMAIAANPYEWAFGDFARRGLEPFEI